MLSSSSHKFKTRITFLTFSAKWKENGGAMLIGYEMFRLLSSKKAAPSKAKSRSKKTEVIDVEEEDKNKSLMIGEFSNIP